MVHPFRGQDRQALEDDPMADQALVVLLPPPEAVGCLRASCS